MIFNPGYDKLTQEEKKEICNGVGPKGLIGDLIPETILGLSVTEEANIHDYGCYIARTLGDKIVADCIFFFNLWNNVTKYGGFFKWFRQNRAINYFKIVLRLGHLFLDEKMEKPKWYVKLLKEVFQWCIDNRDNEMSYEIIRDKVTKLYVRYSNGL
jgi:hypothetical protein